MVPSRSVRALVGMVLTSALVQGSAPTTAASAESDLATCNGFEATIVGTGRRDVINGTEGPDVIVGLDGPDQIFGNGGDDVICGGDSPDELYGGEGNDQLFGERALGDVGDDLDGGPGDDQLSGGQGGEHDDVHFSGATGGVTVDLLAGTSSGPGVGSDTINGVIHVFATDFDDTIRNATLVEAGDGDDVISGAREVYTTRPINAGPGNDRVFGTRGNYSGGPGNDRMVARGESGLYGDEGDDTLLGWVHYEGLYGGPGNDVIRSRGGDDLTHGGPGDDDIAGGSGDDRLEYDREDTAVIVNRRAGTSDGTSTGHDTLRGIEEVVTTMFDDIVIGRFTFAFTGDGDDVIRGATGGYGHEGNDLIIGTRGADDLGGYWGDDVIRGRAGDDVIDGYTGFDVGNGGRGTDTCENIDEATACEAG